MHQDKSSYHTINLEDFLKITVSYPATALSNLIQDEITAGGLTIQTIAEMFTIFNNPQLVEKYLKSPKNFYRHLELNVSPDILSYIKYIITSLKNSNISINAQGHLALNMMIAKIKKALATASI